jgi:hypothetical protein
MSPIPASTCAPSYAASKCKPIDIVYNECMKLDKALYRQAQEWYRQWNEAELHERVRSAGTHSPLECWEQYVDLWEFGWQTKITPGLWQEHEKINSINQYYSRIKKMEAWRSSIGAP